MARQVGASAIEDWPPATSAPHSAEAFLGREAVFQAAGFSCVDRPAPQRAIMRIDLSHEKRR